MNKTAAQQPARESNIDAIVEFFEGGIKPADRPGELGIELEQTIVHDDMSPVAYSDEHGVSWVLHQLANEYPTITYDTDGDIVGVARQNEAVTIEPAAQIELSAGPFASLACAHETFNAYQHQLANILKSAGEQAVATGYHPTAQAQSLELIPKQRYRFMNRYLSACDTCGPCMMRGSASTQVSIDYTSTADCLRKLRLAFALVPLLSLICDNAPVFEGKPRKHRLVRTHIWRHVDAARCGLVPGVLDPSFSLRHYAEYILDTIAILVPNEQGQWNYSERTFGDIYAARTMTKKDVEHALSMFFTDVRLKTYIEIRPADAMPIPYVIAYAALIKGLFYSPSSLDALDELFECVNDADYLDAQNALMQHGYGAKVYGKPAAELCDIVVRLAEEGLANDEKPFLAPIADLVARRTTLADIAERGERA